MPALDCSPPADTMPRRTMRPHRHAGANPRLLFTLDPRAVLLGAARVLERIQANQRAGKGRSWLFIDPEMRVYVIHDLHSATPTWTADPARLRYFVAAYTSVRGAADGLTATLDGVAGDIRQHLDDLRRLR